MEAEWDSADSEEEDDAVRTDEEEEDEEEDDDAPTHEEYKIEKLDWKDVQVKLATIDNAPSEHGSYDLAALMTQKREDAVYFGFPSLLHLCCTFFVEHGISEEEFAELPEEIRQRLAQFTP